MTKDMLHELQKLAPPPAHPIYAGDANQWDQVEQKLGTVLPQDYKQLVNCYGLGSFGDRVCLLSPFIQMTGKNSHLSLFRGIHDLRMIEPFQIEALESFQPFPIYPASGGLLPWGRECQDGGMQCWHTGGSPETWSSVILDNDWSEEYHEFTTSVTGFLLGWLTGKIAISYYPKMPFSEPLFQPLVSLQSE